MFPRGSDTLDKFHDFDAAFGTDDTLLVAVHDDSLEPVFNEQCLGLLRAIIAAVEDDPAVDSVMSVANLEDFQVQKKLFLEYPTAPRPYLPESVDEITDADRKRYRRDPMLQQGLLAKDGSAAACWIMLQADLRGRSDYLEEIERLRARIPEPPEGSGLRVFVTGFPVLHRATLELLWTDGIRLLAGALLLVTLVLVIGGIPARCLGAYFLSWPVSLGLLGTWFRLTDRPLHMFSNTVLPLLLITSTATLVHCGRAIRLGHSLRQRWRACLLTAITTSLGFATLSLSPLEPLARLGTEIALGSLVTFVVLSGFLQLVAKTAPSASVPATAPPARRRRPVVVLGVLMAAPWFLLAPERFQFLGDLLRYLPPSHPAVQDARAAEEVVGAQAAFEVVVSIRTEETDRHPLTDPAFYRRLTEFEEALIESAGGTIGSVLSPVTLLKYLNTKLEPDQDPVTEFRVTDRAAKFAVRWLVAPYLSWFAGTEAADNESPLVAALRDSMKQLLSTDGTRVRFGCRIPEMQPEAVLSLAERLQREVFPEFETDPRIASIYTTGYSVLVSETAREVGATQLRSLLWGGAALAILLFLVLRSWRIWALAIVANVMTVVALANLLWAAQIHLNLYSTVLTVSLLAIIVDDTLHLLLACKQHGSIDRALQEVGPSLRLSSVSLAAGFGLFFASALPVYQQFAISAICGIGLAYLYDVWVLPAALRRFASADPAH